MVVAADPGAGGYAVATDADLDGAIGDDEVTSVSSEDLEQLISGAVDALNIEFDGDEYVPATSEDTVPPQLRRHGVPGSEDAVAPDGD